MKGEILEKIENCESIDEKITVCRKQLPDAEPPVQNEVIPVVLKDIVHEEVGDVFVGAHLGAIADISGVNFTKTSLKKLYKQYKEEEVDSLGTEQKIPLDKWLMDNVEKVVKKTTTDTNVDVTYIFHIQGEQKTIETKQDHYSFTRLSKLVYKQFDAQTADPSEKANDAWGDWIEAFITRHKEEEEFVGPRTQVIEELQERIDGSDAYTDIELAYNRRRIHYDEEEDAYNVPSRLITSVCEEFGITPEALSSEMKKKEIVASGGCSTKKQVGDHRPRFWEIPSDFANANIVSEEDEEFDTSRYGGENDV